MHRFNLILLIKGQSHYILSNKNKITTLQADITKKELELKEAKEQKQNNVLADITEASETLNHNIKVARTQADKLKDELSKVVLVTKDCKPSVEFERIWNESGKQ